MSHRDIEIIIPRGCACQGVTIGGYENQVVLPTPQFMRNIGSLGCLTFREETCIDRCVVSLVQALWERGVVTTGACCGHNIRDGYIGIYESGETHEQ